MFRAAYSRPIFGRCPGLGTLRHRLEDKLILAEIAGLLHISKRTPSQLLPFLPLLLSFFFPLDSARVGKMTVEELRKLTVDLRGATRWVLYAGRLYVGGSARGRRPHGAIGLHVGHNPKVICLH